MQGIYILLIDVPKPIRLTIGALGTLSFEKGTYAYIGSAMNNLEKRIMRHLSTTKRTHWHIDYLLFDANVAIKTALYKETDNKSMECNTAQRLLKCGTPVKGFGCSDCRCITHLIRIENNDCVRRLPFNEYFHHQL